jgi:Methylamine utilisation protein MauE
MVETITPMVHGGSRTRWAGAVAVHTLAATIVAGVFGGALGGIGRLLGAPWAGAGWPLVGLVALAGISHELFATPFPVPQLRRQVPNWWRTFFGPYPAAALYGGALGVGFLTFITHATLVVVCVAAIASGRPVVGAAMLAPFGFARGIGALVAASAGGDVVERLARIGSGSLLPVANAVAVALVCVATIASRPGFAMRDAAGLAAAVLASTFAWSATWKLLRPAAWRRVLSSHRLDRVGPAAAVGVPLAELAVPSAFVVGRPAAAAAVASAILLAGAAAVVRAGIRFGPHVACGCFGQKARDYRVSLARNALLVGISIASMRAPTRVGVAISIPGASDVAPLALVLVGAGTLAWSVVAVGRALRRSEVGS